MGAIDADALKQAIKYDFETDDFEGTTYISAADILRCIDRQPTIDAVPVIRCKNCKHYIGGNWCEWYWELMNKEDFCPHGERKAEGERETGDDNKRGAAGAVVRYHRHREETAPDDDR